MNYLIIFLVSLHCILLELFLTRILNLKAWNHVVYIIIPFAMLGYGIGANLEMLFFRGRQSQNNKALYAGLMLIGLGTLATTMALIRLPIGIQDLLSIFTKPDSLIKILTFNTLFMIPFILMGYVIVHLFNRNPKINHTLYFFDLVGAGLGALMFYFLINHLAVFPSIFLSSLLVFLLGASLLLPRYRYVICGAGLIAALGITSFAHEPFRYMVDESKGWEFIPAYYSKNDYQEKFSRWHPLGRTNLYRMTSEKARADMMKNAPVTFDINLDPVPEFSFFSTNFLAGTPVYHLNSVAEKANESATKLFSKAEEAPYLLLNHPKVLVIGAGGGRDIFFAQTHGAKEVHGAEINPAIYEAMSAGGIAYEYSGRIYDALGTKVFNVDGRYIAKKAQPNSLDLIVLNGVDTFSGLSSGAYAYAESYLYTKEAIKDFFKTLGPDGIINYNRWLFADMPRESLRLEAIALQALKESGVASPWENILIGRYHGWSITMIKKTPYTQEQIKKVVAYFREHETQLIFPSGMDRKIINDPLMYFDVYAEVFKRGFQKEFLASYCYDISVVTDDNPFFYKYYKFKDFHPTKVFMNHHDGTVVFLTQFLVFMQACFFILLFIVLPLLFLRGDQFSSLSGGATAAFILYFSCLGAGFMFIEIPLMQRFVLLLASPIYSISVILASLLVATGIGSFLIPNFVKIFKTPRNVIGVMGWGIFAYLSILVFFGAQITDAFLPLPFLYRACIVAALVMPLGMMLGVFFPVGLAASSQRSSDAVAWAWGINSGFSVLGGILAIIIGQFTGFKSIMLTGGLLYLLAILAFRRFSQDKPGL